MTCTVTYFDWLVETSKTIEDATAAIVASRNGDMCCVLTADHDGPHKWKPLTDTEQPWKHNGGRFEIGGDT